MGETQPDIEIERVIRGGGLMVGQGGGCYPMTNGCQLSEPELSGIAH